MVCVCRTIPVNYGILNNNLVYIHTVHIIMDKNTKNWGRNQQNLLIQKAIKEWAGAEVSLNDVMDGQTSEIKEELYSAD